MTSSTHVRLFKALDDCIIVCQVAHASQSNIEEEFPGGCEVCIDITQRAYLGLLRGQHDEGIRGDEDGSEPLIVAE